MLWDTSKYFLDLKYFDKVWKIKGDHLRSKVCPPLRGGQRGAMNSWVEKSRGVSDCFQAFKYGSRVKNEGNLLMCYKW